MVKSKVDYKNLEETIKVNVFALVALLNVSFSMFVIDDIIKWLGFIILAFISSGVIIIRKLKK